VQVLLKMLTEGARTYRALVPDHKYKMLAVFAAIHCRVLSVGPDGSRSDIGQLAPAPAWERENDIKNTFRLEERGVPCAAAPRIEG
jgi:hypothetical protein